MPALTETEITDSAGRTTNLQLLWSARRKLFYGGFLGLICSAIAAVLIPAQYESTVQLMPPDPQSGSGIAMLAALSSRMGDSLGAVSSDLLGMKSSEALFLGILNSRTVQDRLSARFNLKQVYGKRLNEDVRRELASNTRAWEDRHSGIITVAVTDHDRQRAAQIAAAYVEELNRLVAEVSTSAAHRERVFLEQRLADVKHDLDQASGQFSQFASANTAIDIKEQGRAMIDVAASLTGQLIAAESELTGLKQIYTSNNVRVRAVEARVRELRGKLGELSGAESSPQQNGGNSQPYPTLRQLPLLGVTYADLYRQTKIQESVYQTLTEQYELAKVQEAKETPTVRVLDAPVVPERSSFPPRLQIVFLGMCLGIAARTAAILLRARWETLDALDPRKVFCSEVWQVLHARSLRMRDRWLRSTHCLAWIIRLKREPSAIPADQN
jgi:uncharacterized protein involved in exopolysaccharide biosynthesis